MPSNFSPTSLSPNFRTRIATRYIQYQHPCFYIRVLSTRSTIIDPLSEPSSRRGILGSISSTLTSAFLNHYTRKERRLHSDICVQLFRHSVSLFRQPRSDDSHGKNTLTSSSTFRLPTKYFPTHPIDLGSHIVA